MALVGIPTTSTWGGAHVSEGSSRDSVPRASNSTTTTIAHASEGSFEGVSPRTSGKV